MELNGQNHVVVDAEVMPFDGEAKYQEMLVELEQARAENARLKAEREQKMTLTLKVSEKGGISVYGLGRFPVTLYPEQWEKIGKIIPQIEAFSKANWKEINAKNTAARAAKAAKK